MVLALIHKTRTGTSPAHVLDSAPFSRFFGKLFCWCRISYRQFRSTEISRYRYIVPKVFLPSIPWHRRVLCWWRWTKASMRQMSKSGECIVLLNHRYRIYHDVRSISNNWFRIDPLLTAIEWLRRGDLEGDEVDRNRQEVDVAQIGEQSKSKSFTVDNPRSQAAWAVSLAWQFWSITTSAEYRIYSSDVSCRRCFALHPPAVSPRLYANTPSVISESFDVPAYQ